MKERTQFFVDPIGVGRNWINFLLIRLELGEIGFGFRGSAAEGFGSAGGASARRLDWKRSRSCKARWKARRAESARRFAAIGVDLFGGTHPPGIACEGD